MVKWKLESKKKWNQNDDSVVVSFVFLFSPLFGEDSQFHEHMASWAIAGTN